jgi:hypothetical protein
MSDDEEIEAYWQDVQPPAVEAPAPEPVPTPDPPFTFTEDLRKEAIRLFALQGPDAPEPDIQQGFQAPDPGAPQNQQFNPRNVRLIRAMHVLWVFINVWLYGGLTSWHDAQWHWAWHSQWAIGEVLVYLTGLAVAAAISSLEG